LSKNRWTLWGNLVREIKAPVKANKPGQVT